MSFEAPPTNGFIPLSRNSMYFSGSGWAKWAWAGDSCSCVGNLA